MSQQNPSAATDVSEFITDLDGGQLERKLSTALSTVAIAVQDLNKVGEVTLKLKLTKVDGTSQVAVSHQLTYAKPTTAGRVREEEQRATVMHVGKYGRLALVPESQFDMFKANDKAKA